MFAEVLLPERAEGSGREKFVVVGGLAATAASYALEPPKPRHELQVDSVGAGSHLGGAFPPLGIVDVIVGLRGYSSAFGAPESDAAHLAASGVPLMDRHVKSIVVGVLFERRLRLIGRSKAVRRQGRQRRLHAAICSAGVVVRALFVVCCTGKNRFAVKKMTYMAAL